MFSEMRSKEFFGLLYACKCFYYVVGNYLIEPHDLIVHHVSIYICKFVSFAFFAYMLYTNKTQQLT